MADPRVAKGSSVTPTLPLQSLDVEKPSWALVPGSPPAKVTVSDGVVPAPITLGAKVVTVVAEMSEVMKTVACWGT